MKFILLIALLLIAINQISSVSITTESQATTEQLTDEQLNTIAMDIFNVYDFNGSGYIETDELIPALQAVQDQAQTGYVVDRAFAQLVLNQMDTNMDNKLTFEEFKKIIYAFMVENSPV